MERRQVHVRVRIGSGEVIDALVLEWLSYPDRALVQLPSRQRPSVVRLNATTGLYSARSLPTPTPQWGVVLAGLLVGGVLLGFLVPPSPPARPAVPAATTSWTPPPPAPEPPPPPAQLQSSTSLPLASAKWTMPPRTTPHAPAAAPTVPPARPSRAKPAPSHAARYEARLTALSSEAARRGARACKCGATFHSAQELEAHQTGVVYACIRYPACQATASSPDAILKHYEKERNTGGRCWFEAVRLGSSYAVVKRPKCRTLAANPNRRKVIKVQVRPNFMNDDSPWR